MGGVKVLQGVFGGSWIALSSLWDAYGDYVSGRLFIIFASFHLQLTSSGTLARRAGL